MPLDCALVNALAMELDGQISGMRIDKIFVPERDELNLALRGQRLLISAGANYPRLHLTGSTKENPAAPPMFCMLLRKHLTSAKIISVTQPTFERAVFITLEGYDELHNLTRKTLVAEMLGRHSNVILCDREMRITDCLKRVDFETSQKRQLLPGLFYHLPPEQDKADILSPALTAAKILQMLEALDPDTLLEKWFISTFAGLSPLICREIVHLGCSDVSARKIHLDPSGLKALAQAAFGVFELIRNKNFTPVMLLKNGVPADFSFMPITQYQNQYEAQVFGSFSQLLDQFYLKKDLAERMRQKSQNLLKTITNLHTRAQKKLTAQDIELETAKNREHLKIMGELITANLYRLEKGMNSFTAENYYDNMAQIEIKLDVQKTPSQNAARYFKEYSKLKSAQHFLTKELEQGRAEIAYLASIITAITQAASAKELAEISEELGAEGYVKTQRQTKNRPAPLAPRRFISPDGFEILAGRNNRTNDALTLKTAAKTDIWLHAQNMPGSHVVILTGGQEVPNPTLEQAAQIAAFYSKGRESTGVSVDYTQVKFVKKPPRAKPGMVIYTDYRTVVVTPKEHAPQE